MAYKTSDVANKIIQKENKNNKKIKIRGKNLEARTKTRFLRIKVNKTNTF